MNGLRREPARAVALALALVLVLGSLAGTAAQAVEGQPGAPPVAADGAAIPLPAAEAGAPPAPALVDPTAPPPPPPDAGATAMPLPGSGAGETAPGGNPETPPADDPDPVIPAAHGLYRYEPIWSKSPFMLETPLATTVAESFARDLAITSVSVIDGKTRVGLVNTKTRTLQTATTEAPNENGIRVLKVVANPDPSKVEVELEGLNAEKSNVAFDALTLQGKPSIPNPAPAARPPGTEALAVPGLQPQPQSVQAIPGRPAGTPGAPGPTSPTRRRIVLPKSITTPTNAPQQAPQQAPVPPPFLQEGGQPVPNQ